MRIPNLRYSAAFLQGAGLFIAGAIVGAAALNAVMHNNFNHMVNLYDTLKHEYDKMKLQADLEPKAKVKTSVVARITIHIEAPDGSEPLDVAVVNELKDRLNRDLKVIIGKPAGLPDLYAGLINKDYLDVIEKDYRIRLNYLSIIQSEMQIWVTARPFLRN